MKIAILHDSRAGNGARLAAVMKDAFEAAGAEVSVGHVAEISAESVAEMQPNLLVLGAAIRKFRTSPASKRWLSQLDRALRMRNAAIARAATFVTHGLPDGAARGWGLRFLRRIERARTVSAVYPVWLSARVVAPGGPFEDGTEDRFRGHAVELLEWTKG